MWCRTEKQHCEYVGFHSTGSERISHDWKCNRCVIGCISVTWWQTIDWNVTGWGLPIGGWHCGLLANGHMMLKRLSAKWPTSSYSLSRGKQPLCKHLIGSQGIGGPQRFVMRESQLHSPPTSAPPPQFAPDLHPSRRWVSRHQLTTPIPMKLGRCVKHK